MKARLLQIIYIIPFAGLDHENSYTHLTKFYKIYGTLRTLETNEEAVFLIILPYSLIGKAKE